jgi:DNA-binding CsgD family transcriptional regulator
MDPTRVLREVNAHSRMMAWDAHVRGLVARARGEHERAGELLARAVGRSMLVALLDRQPATDGRRSLCRALLALACAALDEVSLARRLARQAIHDSARPPCTTPGDELRRLRLARALAVNASYLVGDVVRSRRASQARFVVHDADSRWLMDAGLTASWPEAPPAVQRYAKFVAAVRSLIAQRARSGPLTAAEVKALSLVASGHSAVAAAERIGRSAHTVRTHLRNAYAKLGAHGRQDAVNRARSLGLLD